MHSSLRDWIPPIVLRAVRALRRSPTPGPSDFEYLPGGWPEAEPGWDSPGVVEHARATWPRFLQSQEGCQPLFLGNRTIADHNGVLVFNYALARAAHRKAAISMLDYGGGVGQYLIRARAALPGVEIDFHCRDLPILADAGCELVPDATFHADDGCFDRTYDFVLASSSLQYARDWRGVLGLLAGAVVAGGLLLVTRAPVHEGAPAFVFRQRAYGTEYVAWSLDESELVGAAVANGLSIEREFWINEIAEPIPGAPAPTYQRGYLCRRPS
jgi:putative methyltransferase (TIGR04325 family)